MKKLFFLFVMMSAAFHSTDAFAKAQCPQGMTQSECCASKQTYDLYEAESICGEGNYTIKGVYYAGCYVCASSSNTVICKPGCAACISAKLCKKCEAGFYLKTGTCYPCSAIAVENGTCTACSSTGTCTAVSCNEGYRANGAKCERITCSAGQYVNGNSCAACPSGTYSEGGTATSCTSCASGTWSSARASSCRACSSIIVSNGICTACSSTGTCTAVSCNSGYKANGTTCEKIVCPAHCSSCNVGGYCIQCESGYMMTADRLSCIKPCSAGQYWNGSSCVNCSAGTYSAGGTATSCTSCASGTWSSAGARSCTACSSISVSNGTCTACSSTGTCTAVSCNEGYRANGNVCESVLCSAGEYLSGSTCKACSTIPVENGTCKACTSGASCDAVDCNIGYKTVGTTCVKVECPLNCAACDSWGFCYQCENGYTLSDDRLSCLPACSENCKTCSNGVCTDCDDGYTLNDGKCLDCSVYNVGNGTCTACDEYSCTDAECNGINAFFNPTFRKCGVECDANQYLDSSYTCRDCPAGQTSPGGWFANPTNCYSCDSIPVNGGRCTECKNGSCTKAECEDGYVLDSTGRTCIAALASCLSPLKISDDGCCCVK